MLGLLLSLSAASISFVLLILSKKENTKKKIVLFLATTGFLIVLGQQFVSYFSSKASSNIIDNINRTATRIDSTVSINQILLTKLNNTSIDKIGIEIQSLEEVEYLKYFDKGAPRYWKEYYSWLNTEFDGIKALRFKVNNNRHYVFHLILFYLITNKENHNYIEQNLARRDDFGQRQEDWVLINSTLPLCDIVIFEGRDGNVLGFAKTRELVKNLNVMGVNEDQRKGFIQALNAVDADFYQYAINNLTSFRIAVEGESLAEISNKMINDNLGETIAKFEYKDYYLQISSLFELK